jgi:hypothetical protein
MLQSIRSYEAASEYLGTKNDRPVGNNTRLTRRDDGWIQVKYHGSPVVTFVPGNDQTVILDSCGWKTLTTKERLNAFCPADYRVWQERSVWYLHYIPAVRDPQNKTYTFADGITILSGGRVVNAGPASEGKEIQKLTRKIGKYAKTYAAELIAGKIPAPDSGDCWFCAFKTDDGEHPGGTDHLISHLDESYLVPSLLLSAINAQPGHFSDFSKWALQSIWQGGGDISNYQKSILARDTATTLTVYFKRALNIAR